MPDAAPNPLPGAWRLQSWETSFSDGRAQTRPFGERPEGLILYTHDGWMSASITHSGRTAASAEAVAGQSDGLDSFINYAGRYRIDGDSVVHAVTLALNPAFVGTEQRRKMQFAADTLTLSGEDRVPGTEVRRVHRLVWRKAA